MAHDGTATAIAVEEVEGTTPDIQGFDPMELRWAINTTVRGMVLDGKRSKTVMLPYGKWFAVTRFNTRDEFHSIDEQAPREMEVTRTAQSAQVYLEEALAGKDEFGNRVAGKRDKGLKVDFYGEKDAGKMAVISRALLPSLPEIRTLCETHGLICPITPTCDGQDDLDFGDRETCPTCWLQWIQSDACEAYLKIVAKEGMSVYNADDPTNERTVRPWLADMLKARELTTLSLQTGIAALQGEWSAMLGEIDKGERKGFDEAGYQHGMRKDIHMAAPEHRDLERVRQFARESAAAARPGADNSEILAALAQSAMQTNALLGQLVQQGGVPTPATPPEQAPAPEPEPAPVDSPANTLPVAEVDELPNESPVEEVSLSAGAQKMEAAKQKNGKNKE